ncbi:MAG: GFA family protein [Pararhodobacter sp.]
MSSHSKLRRSRTASCQCGTLSVRAVGEPDFVNICHCGFCQRRSGSAFSYNAYYPAHAIEARGPSLCYARDGAEQRKLRNHFCPDCGTTLFWCADLRPDHIGIAVGAFNDPDYSSPSASLWERSIYSWVGVPSSIQRFDQGLPSTLLIKP